MSKINAIWNVISHYKYLIVVVIGVAVVGFIDDNSFRKRIQYEMEISDLKAEIAKYNSRYEADSKRLQELKSNPKIIERIARERYFMKTDDEDIFVLSTDIAQGGKGNTEQ
jgi:cell division protein FtsB